MSKSWMENELDAASVAMKAAGQMSREEFTAELDIQQARKLISDYSGIMYKDEATRKMLMRYGDKEMNALNTDTLIEISTYVTVAIGQNPFAIEVCKRAQGANFTGHVTYKLYLRVCKGYGYII